MRGFRVLGLTVMTMFVLGVVAAASASAITLPEFTVETPGVGTFGKYRSEGVGGAAFECASGTFGMEMASHRTGSYQTVLSKCTGPFGSVCTSPGEPSGTILFSGTFALVPLLPSGVAVLETINELHLTCVKLPSEVTIIVKGDGLVPITPVGGGTHTSFTLLPKQVKGKQDPSEFENDAGAMVKAQPLCAAAGGVFEECAAETLTEGVSKGIVVTTSKATEVKEN